MKRKRTQKKSARRKTLRLILSKGKVLKWSAAFFALYVLIVVMADWRVIWICIDARRALFSVSDARCCMIEKDSALEFSRRRGLPVWRIVLEDGTVLTIPTEMMQETDSAILASELEFLKEADCSYTFIPRDILAGGYPLISIRSEGETILSDEFVIDEYEGRLALVIPVGIVLISLLLVNIVIMILLERC